MRNERFQITLPDDTKLIAESEQNSDYPSINIYFENAAGDFDTVAFAEYNPEKGFGKKLCVGAHANDDDDTKYYASFCKCIKPSFYELKGLYSENRRNQLSCKSDGGFIEVLSDDTVIYRDFLYDDESLKNHINHDLELVTYTSPEGIRNISIECLDCKEVVYSVDNPLWMPDEFRLCEFSPEEATLFYREDTERRKRVCIGYLRADFGRKGREFWTTWTDVNVSLKTEVFRKEFDVLINDYLRLNILSSLESMRQFIDEYDEIRECNSSNYGVKFVSAEYTYCLRATPMEDNYNAYIFVYPNKELYTEFPVQDIAIELPGGGSGVLRYVKHLGLYQNPDVKSINNAKEKCWELFQMFSSFVGADLDDATNPDIVKAISDKIIGVVEKTFGVPFPTTNQQEEYK